MIGRFNHVAQPCDDDGGRSWDVVRRDTVVAEGFRTRRVARYWGKTLDAKELDDMVEDLALDILDIHGEPKTGQALRADVALAMRAVDAVVYGEDL